MNAIIFEAEVTKAITKKDGIDRRVIITLETNDDTAMELRKYIADKTVIISVEENKV